MSKDLTWKSHILCGEKAVLPGLKRKIGALYLVSKYLNKESKLRLANGIVMSRIIYCCQIWGTAKKTWIRRMQVVQNLAARYVTGLPKHTRLRKILEECNWMSVWQLIAYHSCMLLWKTVQKHPGSVLLRRIRGTRPGGEEQLPDGTFDTTTGRTLLSDLSWRTHSVRIWNRLPVAVRMETNIISFKKILRNWVVMEFPLKPG